MNRRGFFIGGGALLASAPVLGQPRLGSSTPIVAAHPGAHGTPTAYYFSPAISASSATSAMVADRLHYQPIVLPGAVTRIGIEVTTGAAGTCRLGIYSNVNGLPGSLIVDAGDVDTTNIALVEATIAVTLGTEWVWLAANFSSTPTVRVGALNNGVIGNNNPSTPVRGIYAALAYGALPATATTPTNNTTSGACPAIWLRQA